MTRRVAMVAAVLMATIAIAAPASALFLASPSRSVVVSSATLAPASGLTLTWVCPNGSTRLAQLDWTASASSFADGYLVELVDTTGAVLTSYATASTTYTSPNVTKGTTVHYRVLATASNWRSAPVEVTGTAPTGKGKNGSC